jgi:hypothetical protein
MKRRFSTGLALAFLIAIAAASTILSVRDASAADPVTLEVFDPTGAIEVTQLFAPRLADIHGKTICEVSNGSWEDRRTFPLIRELLQKQFPTTKFIPFTDFPVGSSKIDVDKIGDMVKQKGCQAAIVGNAG